MAPRVSLGSSFLQEAGYSPGFSWSDRAGPAAGVSDGPGGPWQGTARCFGRAEGQLDSRGRTGFPLGHLARDLRSGDKEEIQRRPTNEPALGGGGGEGNGRSRIMP